MSRYMIESVPEKCKACRRCEIACIAAHHGLTFKEALKKRDELVARVHVVKSGSVKSPISCRQCENAPCARICPTGALQQDDGIVTMNAQICSGCQLCIMAGPYGAISLESIGLPSATSETMAQKSMRSRGRALRPVQGLDEARGQIRARLRRSLPRPRPKRGADRLIPAQSLMV